MSKVTGRPLPNSGALRQNKRRECVNRSDDVDHFGTARWATLERRFHYGSYSYQSIKGILEKNLDADSPGQDGTSGTMPEHDNIRGTDYYNRFDPDPDSDAGEEDALV